MQTCSCAKEKVWIELIAMRGVNLKTTKLIITNTDGVTGINKTSVIPIRATLCTAVEYDCHHSGKDKGLFAHNY